jgi:phospholipid/cholesterol/gamma-HCH transport system permease protein
MKKLTKNLRLRIENIILTLPRAVAQLGAYIIFLFKTIKSIFKRPFPLKETLHQSIKIGYESLGVTVLTNFLMGAVMALNAGVTMERLMSGASAEIGAMGLAIVTELGPVLTGIIVAGKTGSAMAAQIGTMKITEQIDALKTLSTDPIQYISVPRFLAGIITMPILIFVADVTGILGGFIVAAAGFEQNFETFFKKFLSYTAFYDVFVGLYKAAIFGAIISTISSFMGFQTKGGAEGVGKATTGAVVLSSMGILLADLLISALHNISL